MTIRRADGIGIAVRVTPRSARNALEPGPGHGVARLNAPPVDGAANAALIDLVAAHFGVAKRDVRLIAGERARLKRLAIRGDAEALAKIAAALYQAEP
ncbi:MAG: DUF167 domain-containing protein [Sphingomonas sp.]|uniref:DUF167 domain-containing protein n=1 Tax=Sphingomonas sp. TaxID=28214 RepID=UPI003F7FFA0D